MSKQLSETVCVNWLAAYPMQLMRLEDWIAEHVESAVATEHDWRQSEE